MTNLELLPKKENKEDVKTGACNWETKQKQTIITQERCSWTEGQIQHGVEPGPLVLQVGVQCPLGHLTKEWIYSLVRRESMYLSLCNTGNLLFSYFIEYKY